MIKSSMGTVSKKLKPISTLSLVDKVEIGLREYISEAKLKPGDALPKELEISKFMGVSRTVVREALLRLRMLGIIDSKKHRGMILTQLDVLKRFESVLDPYFLDNSTLKDLFELRLILEVGMADMIFARKTEKNIKQLEEIVIEGENLKNNPSVSGLKNEIRFHKKLYEISGNSTLHKFQSLLLPVFQYVHDSGMFDKDYNYSPEYVNHRKLLVTIKNGTSETFRSAMRNHLQPHFERVL